MYIYCTVKTITIHIVHIGLPIINFGIETFKIFFFFYFQHYILLIKDIKSNPIHSPKNYLLNILKIKFFARREKCMHFFRNETLLALLAM